MPSKCIDENDSSLKLTPNDQKIEDNINDTNICCNGIKAPKIDSREYKNIYAYIDRIYDTKSSCSNPLSEHLVLNNENSLIFIENYTKSNGCCGDCNLLENSIFNIHKISVELLSANLSRGLKQSNIFINNKTPIYLNSTNPNSYEISLVNLTEKPSKKKDKKTCSGQKASILIDSNDSDIEYSIKLIIAGKVSTKDGDCDFSYEIITDQRTYGRNKLLAFIPEICIPIQKTNKSPYLLLSFNYGIKLLSPEIKYSLSKGPELLTGLFIYPRLHVESILPIRGIVDIYYSEDEYKDKDKDKIKDKNKCAKE